MRAVLQRVSEASVEVGGCRTGAIGSGLLVLVAVAKGDSESDADYLAAKISQLRIFEDEQGKMNRSILETNGSLLIVSQFTLYADCSRGRRPAFDQAAPPLDARRLYEYFVERCKSAGLPVETGVFQATMKVSLSNEGPVTVILDSVH